MVLLYPGLRAIDQSGDGSVGSGGKREGAPG